VELAASVSPEREAPSPSVEYMQRLDQRLRLKNALERRHRHIAHSRIAIFLIGALVAWLAFGANRLSPWWLALPITVFFTAVIWHERVSRALTRAGRAAAFYEAGLGRLECRWMGRGDAGTRFLDEIHPNALDLDLFGEGSLFELLCTARTRSGQDTLADWLRTPGSPEQVRARQGAVAELRPRLDLREEIALLGADVPAGVDLNSLVQWGAEAPILDSAGARIAAAGLATLVVTILIAWAAFGVSFTWLAAALLLEGSFALWFSSRVRRVLAPVERKSQDLTVYASILARLEREPFASSRLRQLRAALFHEGAAPSRRIAKLSRIVDWLDAKHNVLFAPLAPFLLWDTQFAFAIESWRGRSGAALARWLAAVGEFETLCSLAGFAYENPDDPFPEISADGPCFQGDDLGHPLLPKNRCVRSSVHLGDELRVLIVSGSNMSGKSTLLRTVGVNAVLALAGAPVRARRLRISPLVVGGTLRIQDSLQAGKSRFYAEITRVHQLIELARDTPPLLFLLDELFQGTNSHDRRIGAEAVVRTFVEHDAIGLATTHDLALTQIADLLAPRAANVHFEDQLTDGKITFDYRMHPGVVQHSNALALMRSVGIEV
jgi:hypothetical protein